MVNEDEVKLVRRRKTEKTDGDEDKSSGYSSGEKEGTNTVHYKVGFQLKRSNKNGVARAVLQTAFLFGQLSNCQ